MLVIMGAGGLAAETYEWITDYTDYRPEICFYADYAEEKKLFGNYIYTTLSHCKRDTFLTAVGNPKTKEKFYEKAIAWGLIPCFPIITKNSIVAKSAQLNVNTMLAPNVTITSRVYINHSAIIHYGCTIGHDCIIDDYFTALPGCNISGNVKIGKYVTVGANACIREKLTITDNVFIGMGAVVVKDILESGIYVGNPAKKLNKVLL